MPLHLFAITIVFAFVGCSSSLLVTPTGDSGDLSFSEINKKVQNDDEVIISMKDGGRVVTKEFRVENDSVLCKDINRGSTFNVPVSQVQSLSVQINRFDGAMNGLGKGLLLGSAVGLIIGSTRTNSRGWEGFNTFAGALEGGAVGALVGVVIGAVVHQSQEFYFTESASKK
jgi:hypothetical protein